MISANYQLLKVKETISENLSSVQIASILDELILNSLKPIIKHSDYMEYSIVELLPHVFINQRRKFSNEPMDELKDNLFSFIVISNKQEKVNIIAKQGLERNIFFSCVSLLENYKDIYIRELEDNLKCLFGGVAVNKVRTDAIEQRFSSTGDFYQMLMSATFWINQAYEFRKMIVEKYIRHAYVESVKMAKSTELNIDQKDLYKDLIMVIHKAIDKYDPKKGALTSYVNIWFMEAKTSYKNNHEYNVAYKMPTNKRKQLLKDGEVQNITLELNDAIAESVEDDSQNILNSIINNENELILNNIACHVDMNKVYCLTNNITYTLTPEELQKQRETLQ